MAALQLVVMSLLVHSLFSGVTSVKNLDGNSLPDEVDWRKKGVVPAVSDQGSMGKSAAYAVTHSVDSYWAIKNGNLVYGSVTEVTECCTSNEIVNKDKIIDKIFDCIVRIGGIAADSDYPKNGTGKCQYQLHKPAIFINGHKDVVAFDEKALAAAVAMTPVVVLVNASKPSFQDYSSGVYSDEDCSPKKLDHALLVVGYGTMDGKDYWICQNTWGSSWGMEGYILIARNAGNMCGIASNATYPV